MKKSLIIAHRGDSAYAPENTLASFGKAIEKSAEGIEFDVRLTKDHEVVVFHDSNLKRIANHDAPILSLTSKELSSFDVGSWFNKKNPDKRNIQFSRERIPTLKTTLEFLIGYKGIIYIELKCRDREAKILSKAVCKVIKGSPLLPQVIVKSFNLDVIPYIQKYCPEVKTATLFAPKVMIILRKEKRLIKIAKELNADYLSLHFSLVTKKLVKKATKQNLKIAIWTANNPRWVKRGLKLGINHIITNDPARLLERRNKILQKR